MTVALTRTRGARTTLALVLASALACASAPEPARDPYAAPVLPLREGATVTGEVAPGHPHVFPLPLEDGTYFEIHIDRPRNELNAEVLEPGVATDTAYVSGEPSADAPGQMLWQVARAPGTHHLRVAALADSPVTYVLTISALHPATERDWSRNRGLAAYDEAKELQAGGRNKEALDLFLQARDLFTIGEYERGVAATYSRRGTILQRIGRRPEARAEHEAAVEHWRRGGDYRSMTGSLLDLASLEREDAHWGSAESYIERALALARDRHERLVEANGLLQFCLLHLQTGGYDLAEDLCRDALELHTELGRPTECVYDLTSLAALHRFRGELDTARTYLSQAQELLAEHPDPRQTATVLNDLAILLDLEGKYLEAVAQYKEALATYLKLGEVAYAGTVLSNMGTIYTRLGDLDASLEYYLQALTRMEEVGATLKRADVLQSLGWVYIQKGRLAEAQVVLDEALEISRSTENKPLLAASLERLGELHIANDRPHEAVTTLEQALALYRDIGSRWREPSILIQLSRAHAALGETERAISLVHDASSKYEEIGRPWGVADCYYRIARIEQGLGHLEAGRRAVEQAVAAAESLRPQAGGDELRTLLSATTRPYYDLYIEILMEQHRLDPEGGHDAEALRESERSRARSLLEILPEADLELGEEVPAELRAERESIRNRLNAKQVESQLLLQSENPDPGALFGMKLDLEALLTDLQEIERKIRLASPHYAALTHPEPVTVGEVQRSLLDSETALLEYSLGEERSFLWLVTDEVFHSYELPGLETLEPEARCVHWLITAFGEPPDPEELDEEGTRCLGDRVPSYRAALAGADPFRVRIQRRRTIQEAFARSAGELSAALLGPPARDGLLPFRLAVVSDGALEYVPLAALPAPGREGEPLVLSHEIVRLPSASVLAFERSQPPTSSKIELELAIVADPVYSPLDERVASAAPMDPTAVDPEPTHDGGAALPTFARLDFSHQEARAIAAFAAPSRTILVEGLDANRTEVTSGALSGARYVHFATHGVIDTQYPQLSSLVLSLVDRNGSPDPGGYLRLHDIYGLDLDDADMVVLSACDTALGREVRGEGLVGLTRGFLYAGAERVVASLWQVQDRATADLMERLYRGLLKENRAPADALRQAQLETLNSREGDYSFPYYWAGFVLQGEWR